MITYTSAHYSQGTMKGFDQTINLILDESHERVFNSESGVEQVVLGLYIIRGDNVLVSHTTSVYLRENSNGHKLR